MPLQNAGIHCSVMRKIFPLKIFYVCQEPEVTLGIYKLKAEVKCLSYFLIVPAGKAYYANHFTPQKIGFIFLRGKKCLKAKFSCDHHIKY